MSFTVKFAPHCLLLAFIAIGIFGCTPKIADVAPVVSESKMIELPPPPTNLSPCKNWIGHPNQSELMDNYVIYQDFMRANEYERAFPLWQSVYNEAPAADGQRNSLFADGIVLYQYKASQEQDSLIRYGFIQKVFELYDEVDRCYPEGGYIKARKAFDYFYTYRDLATKKEIFDFFDAAIQEDGMKTADFVLNPMASLVVDLYFTDEISMEKAQEIDNFLRARLAQGLADCKGDDCDRWKIIQEYTPARLEAFEAVRGFYDCAYFTDKYFGLFEENPTDCEVIRETYGRLMFAGCPETDGRFEQVKQAYADNCAKATGPKCFDILRDGNYQEAIDCFAEQVEKTDDPSKKAQYQLVMAKVAYGNLKKFSTARSYALAAAKNKPNWGDPYMLIGTLYASSGPICGPGRGWDSQIVTWPAIDKWQYAKSIDPSVASAANKLINRYEQYMPSKEDIFQRTLNVGDSFYVGCWIQENTKVRTPN